MFEKEIRSPRDVASAAPTPSKIRVGGRVVAGSDQTFAVADAFATLHVQPAQDLSVEPGYLVVFDGTWDGKVLREAVLVWSQAAPETPADGEFARLNWQGTGRRLAERARAMRVVRHYFDEQRFIEVETPTRLKSPGLDAHVEPIRADGGWLVTSPELHLKRLLVGGMPRVFELARCHRDEELGRYHQPEFALLEWYRLFEPVEAVMRDTEQLVQRVVLALARESTITHSGKKVQVEAPFDRITVAEAIERYAKRHDAIELAERDPDTWFRIWVESIEPAIAERERPVFVTDYPASQAAMSRKKPEDPRVAERFELYCAGVELCNGYGELTDVVEQQERMQREVVSRVAQGQPELPLDERFLASLREGLAPCSGNALGFDRLVMLASGADSVADVVAFPWERN
jgi:elongation factor P--(R)-beta-lysine ligase